MIEFSNPGWFPPPAPQPASRRQRVGAALLLLLALSGAVATAIIWRADTADRHGNFARAVWWRPGVPMYHRQLGESLLLTSPRLAEQQLLAAIRLDPYDPLTLADLTITELALGNWPQAVTMTHGEQTREPNFDDYWRLANLFLSHGDLAGFWQQTRIAGARAQDDYFPSIVSRALTASGNDFPTLRGALPASSAAAASAYLAAAVAQSNRAAALEGARWLLSLGVPRDTMERDARRQAMLALLATAWRIWPGDAPAIWGEAAQAGLLPIPPKAPAAPYLSDANFDPAQDRALRLLVSNPADPLGAILGWSWTSPTGVRINQVLTSDPEHPTAVEVGLDGNEADDVDLVQQWILVPGATRLAASSWSRQIESVPNQGISWRLSDMQNHVLGEIPLSLGNNWTAASGSFTVPGGELRSYRLALHYHRPSGHFSMKNQILVTQVRLQ